jgi:transposase
LGEFASLVAAGGGSTLADYRTLVALAGSFGTVQRLGIEGTGSYGAGLTRWLRGRGVEVL